MFGINGAQKRILATLLPLDIKGNKSSINAIVWLVV